MVFSHPPNPGKDMPVLCLFSDKLRYLHLFTTILLGQCWPCQAEICGCPGTTPVKHLNCMPPTHSCLSKLTFRLVWRHAYLHIEIPWMSGATPPPFTTTPLHTTGLGQTTVVVACFQDHHLKVKDPGRLCFLNLESVVLFFFLVPVLSNVCQTWLCI